MPNNGYIKWKQAGIDYEDALCRFMNNTALYEKFLNKFLDDSCMEDLRQALSENDQEAAFRAAHTLKGVSGNLSLTELFHQISVVTNFLREGNLEAAKERMSLAESAYTKAIGVIQNET